MKAYELECPFCDMQLTIDADPQQLADDKGTLVDCPECEQEIECDYDEASGELTITPGQVEEEESGVLLGKSDEEDGFEDEDEDDAE